jgi:hypothetical protein
MQIKKHDRSHMVELRDGSAWRIWPGDIPKTLEWRPTTEIEVTDIEHELLARPGRSLERIAGSSDKSQCILACRRCPAFAPGGLKQTHAAFAQFRKRLRRPTKVCSHHEFAPRHFCQAFHVRAATIERPRNLASAQIERGLA